MEATILRWLKKPGDQVELDETILEIATDKVDSEIPSPVAGTIQNILFNENDVVEVGKVIATIAPVGEAPAKPSPALAPEKEKPTNGAHPVHQSVSNSTAPAPVLESQLRPSQTERFYSPLVRNIASQENISRQELEAIPGSGAGGRVTKDDVMNYIAQRGHLPQDMPSAAPVTTAIPESTSSTPPVPEPVRETPREPVTFKSSAVDGQVEIIEMDRMRRLIADHMIMSKQTSAHVTSFVEADVTELVRWRDRVKDTFEKKYQEKITFTPLFMEAVIQAIRDFPRINASVEGYNILVKKDINLGMATALPNGNLIVPVIKNADYLNLVGLTKTVNSLADRARNNQLKPEEIQGGTFTLTNVGTFGNVMGTPIINQPQVAILATGAIRKKPAVIETPQGDAIGIRQMMFLSLSYDHRVVDGYLGGSFLRRIADYLEAFDPQRTI